MKKLPIGMSTLANIRNNEIHEYVYIDKTHHVANMLDSGCNYYFLSRPRRFGKSLYLDTLKQSFLGNKQVFTGLYLEHNWDWSKHYPVIHFDLGSGILQSQAQLNVRIHQLLDENYNLYKIENIYDDVGGRFEYLIHQLAKKYANVVLLIDEYDKPILDNISNSEIAIEMREGLKNLYSVIKANDRYFKFVMLTGVSKFSKVSLFSGLNNLKDITLNAQYADICGYTQIELEREFAEYFIDGKIDKEKLKLWYNGYNFAGTEIQKVYNPFDILLFCSNNYEYRSYWFETATPTFLVRLIEKNHDYTPALDKMMMLDSDLSSFDVDNINTATLLFQAGYLTIQEKTTLGTQFAYILTYPNLEVKASLNNSLIMIGSTQENKNRNLVRLVSSLAKADFTQLQTIFTSHFASIPHNWYTNNDIANYEGFYSSVVYSYFAALGYDLIAEDVTNQGRIDLTMLMPDKIIILEFKLSQYGDATQAIAQIKERNYPQKYLSANQPIYLIGLVFDSATRNVSEVVAEHYCQ